MPGTDDNEQAARAPGRPAGEPSAASERAAGGGAARGSAPAGADALPGIDFGTFIMSLASSVLLHLGEMPPPPGERAPDPDLSLAQQTIDILGMLAEKTRGNLTAEEQKLVDHLLYDLRLKYVEAKRRHGR